MLFGSTPPFTVLVFTPLPRHRFKKKKLCRQMMACIFSNKVFISYRLWTSLVSQTVKNLSAMQEIWVWSLGREDLLEKVMAIQSSILAWRIAWTEEPGGLKYMGISKSQTWLKWLSMQRLSEHADLNYCWNKHRKHMYNVLWLARSFYRCPLSSLFTLSFPSEKWKC